MGIGFCRKQYVLHLSKVTCHIDNERSVYHDEVLNDLRREPDRRLVSRLSDEEKEDHKVGKGRYAIPRSGLFRYISFPNYLCEWFV